MFILLVNYCFTLFECLNSSWNKNHRKRKSNNKKLKKRIFCIRKKNQKSSFPGIGYCTAKLSTWSLSALIFDWNSSLSRVCRKSFRAGLAAALFISIASWKPLSTKSATRRISTSFIWRDVNAGKPIRMPLGFMALLSPGHVFLLHAIEISSRTFSPLLPLKPTDRKSTRNRWTSVPPESKGTK